MKFTIEVELTKLSGPEKDRDEVLDALAGSLGRDNAARKPFRFTVGDEDSAARFEIKCVD